MSTQRLNANYKTDLKPYQNFQGIDTSRDKSAMESGDKQHLATMVNCYADWRGSIVRGAGANKLAIPSEYSYNEITTHITDDDQVGGTTELDYTFDREIDRVDITIRRYVANVEQVITPDIADYEMDFLNNQIIFNPQLQVADRVSVASIIVLNDDALIKHVAFYGREHVVWAQTDINGTTLVSDKGHRMRDVYSRSDTVTATVFNKRTVFASRDNLMYRYDGQRFTKAFANEKNDPRGAYCASIQRRLAVAGMPDERTKVLFSRVDNESVMPDMEATDAVQVTKAAYIDVKNLIGTADEITGLGVFETSRLAIFTNDQTLVFEVHPDYTFWQIDDKANVNVGCVSHNSIAKAGPDLLFCSRHGVHSLKRSADNGVTIYSIPMSSKIDILYRDLIRRTPNLEEISAYYDPDLGQYHVFFPVSDSAAERLTLTISPSGEGNKWSTATFLNARCGAHLGGRSVIGTPGGLWDVQQIEDTADATPEMEIVTPILWQGDILSQKQSNKFIIQASGEGTLIIEAYSDEGKSLDSFELQVSDEDGEFPDRPLSRQYERPFQHKYRGVQFRITSEGTGLLRIVGIAIELRSK